MNHIRARRFGAVRGLPFLTGIGATLGAGVVFGTVATEAASLEVPASFVPIEPCRLIDTRPGPNQVGPRDTPLGGDDTYVVQVTGVNGNCEIDEDAVGVALNATATNSTADSYLTFFPAEADFPLSSNVNWAAGQPPTPNKVDVGLSDDGQLAIFNKYGSVDVVVDVTGYYTNETMASVLTRLHALESNSADGAFATTSHVGATNVPDEPTIVVGRVIRAPADGAVLVTSWATPGAFQNAVGECSITTGTTVETGYVQHWTAQASWERGNLTGSRVFPISAGDQIAVRLVCQSSAGTSFGVQDASVSAVFVPGYHDPTVVAATT